MLLAACEGALAVFKRNDNGTLVQRPVHRLAGLGLTALNLRLTHASRVAFRYPMSISRQDGQGCIKLVNHNVAADVSRLKLSNFVRLFVCPAENNDPAHAGCYEKLRA